jgi:hypothetical protein
MNKLNPWRVGIAVALTAAIISFACAALVYINADNMVAFVNSWLHGLDISVLRSDKPWTLGGILLGVFNAALTGFVVGALFAACRNLTAEPRKTD